MKSKLFLIILFLAVTACGGTPKTKASPASLSGQVDADGHVTLEFWYSLGGDSGKAVEELVSRFNQSQSKITINATYQGGYAAIMAKIWSAISSGSTPNVAQLGAAPLLGETGVILPITDFLAGPDGFDATLIRQVFWDYNTAGGKIWSMPFNNSVPVLFYNRDLFAAAGLDPDRPPETIQDLVDYARVLTRDTDENGEIDQWGINTHEDTHWYLSALFLGNGAQIVNASQTEVIYNSPEAVAMLALWSELVNKEKVMPPNQHSEARSDFLAGKLGMLLSSSSGIAGFERDAAFQVGVAMLPAVNGKPRAIPIGGASLVIMQHENEAITKAAWEFVKFMTSEESSLYLSTHTGYLPIYDEVVGSTEFAAYVGEHPNVKAVVQSLGHAVAIPVFSALGTSDTELRKAVENVELGQATPQAALDSARQATQKFMQEQPTQQQ